MLECQGCHRYVHATESSCPFCAAPLLLTSAVSLARMPSVAFAAGLSLLACTESDDDAGESNAVTTDPSTESASTTGDGDGDMGDGDGDTQETLDYSGSDYGGPPPCEELETAIPIVVGSNPIDTTMSGNNFATQCGDDSFGTGPDQLLEFAAPATGQFTFALSSATFEGWLLTSSYYCYANGELECMPNQAVDIQLGEGEILYLILDGSTDGGGTASVDVTQG
jgi:hypothetical protein